MFSPTYHNLPGHQRRLLAVTLLFLAGFAGIYLFLLKPARTRCDEFRAKVVQSEAELLKTQWPHNPRELTEQLAAVQLILNGASPENPGLVDTANAAIAQATCTFRKEIRDRFDDNIQFMNSVTRIDYKDLYDRITSELKGAGVTLKDSHFAPAENNQTPIYQQIFKLWTAELLVQIARRNQLKILTDGEASAIDPLAPIAYVASEAPGTPPYLVEFPVRIRLQGKVADFLAFMSELQNDRRFIPMKHLSVTTAPPSKPVPGTENVVDEATFNVVCSAFLLPE